MKNHKIFNKAMVYNVAFFILDVLCINVCSFLAIFIRFNMSVDEIPAVYFNYIYQMAIPNTLITIALFVFFKLYQSLWRFASIQELVNIFLACVLAIVMNIIMYQLRLMPVFRSYYVLYFMLLFLGTCAIRFSYRALRLFYRTYVHKEYGKNTMIIGAGESGSAVIREITQSKELDCRVCCAIDDATSKHNSYIHGIRVEGGRDKILKCAKKYRINEIIITMPSVSKLEIAKILEICQEIDNCEIKILPGMYQLVKGDVTVSKLRSVEIEDLLGREVVSITSEKIGRFVSGKTVLVTGGGGSIGSELCRQIAANGVSQLIIFDIYENNAYSIQQELLKNYPNLHLVVLIGSVRNSRKINDVFSKYRPQIVFHAAAHKHVPLMETSPNEAIKNNVFGTYKTALAAAHYEAEKFVLISTDKAVNPTNIMGASKRICEMIIQMFSKHAKTDFVAVRFGNVLGSNGSVIPLFKEQIAMGGPITVTHPDIVRYFMTIPEAVSLVLQAGASAQGGEIFVLDMGKPMKIVDLAKNLIKLSGLRLGEDIEIQYSGLRPGEKLYEELLMEEEGLQSTDNKLIYIGKPIEVQEESFLASLNMLYDAATAENDNVKQIVHKLVPTYNLRDEDIEWDNKEKEAWQQEYTDVDASLPPMFFDVTKNTSS